MADLQGVLWRAAEASRIAERLQRFAEDQGDAFLQPPPGAEGLVAAAAAAGGGGGGAAEATTPLPEGDGKEDAADDEENDEDDCAAAAAAVSARLRGLVAEMASGLPEPQGFAVGGAAAPAVPAEDPAAGHAARAHDVSAPWQPRCAAGSEEQEAGPSVKELLESWRGRW